MRAKRAFTLVETMFVMAVASIVLIVLINMLYTFTKNTTVAEKTLDFLRTSTILLDRVRNDIRSAGRGDSVKAGKTVTITREAASSKTDTPGEETVTYEFSEESRTVTRSVKGGKGEEKDVTYGSAGPGLGFITNFEVGSRHPRITISTGKGSRDVDVAGFYEIKLAFADEIELQQIKAGAKPKSTHNFRALVVKRAPEVRDDLWKANTGK